MATTRTRCAGAALGILLLAGGMLSACGSTSGPSITLYNGQHVQTTDALVTAFERATGITVNVRSGDEDDLANQIVLEGSHSPADVIFTENSPALEYLQSKGLLAPADTSTLSDTPSRFNSPEGRLGRRIGPSERPHIQPEPDLGEPVAYRGPRARRSEVQRQARVRSERDGLSTHRDLRGGFIREV